MPMQRAKIASATDHERAIYDGREMHPVAKEYNRLEGHSPHHLVRTCRSGFHPRREELTCFLLRAGSRLAAEAWRPGPANQVVGADMMYDLFQ